MTRQEFIDDITTWSELRNFCWDTGCSICDDVYDDEDKDSYFNERLRDMAHDADDWRDLKSQLDDIPDGYDYYIQDDYGEWYEADDDEFDRHKDDVLEWGDDRGEWDDDEEEDEEDYDEEPAPEEDTEDEEPVEEEDVSIAELFTTCNSKLQKIDADTEAAAKAAEEEAEEAFNDFCAEVGVTVTVEIKGR